MANALGKSVWQHSEGVCLPVWASNPCILSRTSDMTTRAMNLLWLVFGRNVA